MTSVLPASGKSAAALPPTPASGHPDNRQPGSIRSPSLAATPASDVPATAAHGQPDTPASRQQEKQASGQQNLWPSIEINHVNSESDIQIVSQDFQCAVCDGKFRSESEMNEHWQNHGEPQTSVAMMRKIFQLEKLFKDSLTEHKKSTGALTHQVHVLQTQVSRSRVALIQPSEVQPAPEPAVPLPPVPAPQPPQPASRPSYADRTQNTAAPTRPPPAALAKKKIALITDSIAGDMHHDKLEKLTNAKITNAKAYGAVQKTRAEGYRFPKKNFASVVPDVLAKDDHNAVVIIYISKIENKCTECVYISKKTTGLKSHMKKMHGI